MAQNQVIDVPGIGEVEFPDSMSDMDILSAVKRLSAPPEGGLLEQSMRSLNEGKPTPKEPDTRIGGFLKSLSDQVTGAVVNNPAMQGAAHPQTIGDFLSLLIPSGVTETLGTAQRMLRRGTEGARTGKGLMGTAKGFVQGLANDALDTRSFKDVAGHQFNAEPLTKQMDALPIGPSGGSSRTGGPPLRSPVNPNNDLPLYMQQELMNQGWEDPINATWGRTQTPPFQPTPSAPTPAQVVPTRKPSILDKVMGQGGESRVMPDLVEKAGPRTMPDLIPRVPEAPRMMPGLVEGSGPRSMPDLTPPAPPLPRTMNPLLDKIGARTMPDLVPPVAEAPRTMPNLTEVEGPRSMSPLVPETPTPRQMPPLSEPPSSVPRRMDRALPGKEKPRGSLFDRPDTPPTLEQELEGGLLDSAESPVTERLEGVESSVETPPIPEADPAYTGVKAGTLEIGDWVSPAEVEKFTQEDWQQLRGRLGARDAAKITGKTPDEVRALSGGGVSRVPSEARDRIDTYDRKNYLK